MSGSVLGLLSSIYGGTPMDYLDAPSGLLEELVDGAPEVLAIHASWTFLAVAAGMGSKEALKRLKNPPKGSKQSSQRDRTPAEFEAMLRMMGVPITYDNEMERPGGDQGSTPDSTGAGTEGAGLGDVHS